MGLDVEKRKSLDGKYIGVLHKRVTRVWCSQMYDSVHVGMDGGRVELGT